MNGSLPGRLANLSKLESLPPGNKAMPRRNFIKTAAGVVCLSALGSTATSADETDVAGKDPTDGDDFVRNLLRANDELVPGYLERQERRSSHRWRGGIPDGHGIHAVGGAAQFISVLACASCAPGSKFFHAAELVEPLQLAARYLLKAQHDDGTIDLLMTNFHSPPDTGFALEVVCLAFAILNKAPWQKHEQLMADLRTFIVKAGEALVTGGIHTPNHRWVVSAALARIHSLFPDARFVARINQWLEEQVDIDPDGQYTEKSTVTYSPIVNRSLLTMARLLNRPSLYDPVRRNLEMTLYYVHPDGEVVSEASTRQDKYKRGSMGAYYYSYRYLALLDRNGQFAAMARQIANHARGQLVGDLPAFLEDPALQLPLSESQALPTNYAREFSHSGLVRIRRQETSATILAGNPTVFSLHKASAALEALRFASAFFGKGQFVGDKLEVEAGRYVLRQFLDGPYYQPLTKQELERNRDPMKRDRTLRARSNVQKLEAVTAFTETDGKFEVGIDITGTENVPIAVELAFRHGGRLKGVEAVPSLSDTFLLRNGFGQYVYENQVIEFGPGQVEHSWTQLHGALPKWDGLSVYLTGFTPFKVTLKIA